MTRGGKLLASGMRRRSSSSGEPLGSASSGGPLRQRRKSASSRFERPKHLKPPALPGILTSPMKADLGEVPRTRLSGPGATVLELYRGNH